MRAASGTFSILLVLAGMATPWVAASASASGAATGPGANAPAVTALFDACAGRTGWSDEAPPARIVGNVYYVGTCGITALLITSKRGHVLIDGATAAAAPSILRNVRALGFDPRDVRLLLSSHEHADHAGGLAALKAATGARLLARRDARSVLESGRADPADPQAGEIPDFDAVAVDAELRDGEVVRVGPLALTAHATPGHTAGGTTWTWRTCETATRCVDVVYADSLTAVSNERYRFSDHPEWVARFRTSIDAVAALPCEVLITPHPGASRLFERLAGRVPLRDTGACAAYAWAAREKLDARMESERPVITSGPTG